MYPQAKTMFSRSPKPENFCIPSLQYLENRVPVRPYAQALKAQVSGVWLPAMLHSQTEILDQNFFLQQDSPPTSSHCYFGEKNPPQQPTKKLTKNPTDKQTLTHMQRPCLKSCITIFMFFQTRKPKSSLSSFFSGSTDDESVLKLCVPFILDFTSSSCTTQSLTEPYN